MSTSGRLLSLSRAPAYGYSGAYKIEGQTLEGGAQVSRRVVLFPQNSLTPIRDVASSASDGTYSFQQLAQGTYIVLGIDKSGNRNAVVYSHVSAVAM